MVRFSQTRTVVVVCVLGALTMIVLDVRGTQTGDRMRDVVGVVAGPMEVGVHSAMAPIRRVASDRGPDDPARIAELEAQVISLREQLGRAAAGTLSARDAARLAALAPTNGYSRIPAAVIALTSPGDLVNSVTISAGSLSGVAVGMAVICPTGLVGVVQSTSVWTATVRLVSDANTAIGTRVAQSAEMGLFRGSGANSGGVMTLLDPMGKMAIGDLVTTVGSIGGAPFPPGLPLGRITAIDGTAADLSRHAIVETSVDESTLGSVWVLALEAQR